MRPFRPFEIVSHTGDLAVRLWAADPAGLLRSAGLALFALIAPGAEVRPLHPRRIQAEGADLEELLIAWMNRLLLLHALEGLLLCRFDPEPPREGRVEGIVSGEPYDPARHLVEREIKAATYHGLQVERRGELLTARVVLDV